MGFSLSKAVKGVFKGVKKVFKAVGKGLKKLWDSKLGKVLIIGGALVAGAWALGAFSAGGATATAAAQGVAGSGLSSGAGVLGTASEMAAFAPAGEAVAAGTGAAGEIGAAISGGTAVAGTEVAGTAASSGILGAMKGAGESVVNGFGKVAGLMEKYPAATIVAGQGLSSAMQAKAQGDALEDQRRYDEEQRNKQTVYGTSYDGTINQAPQGAAMLNRLNQNYSQSQNILGAQAPVAPAPVQRQKKRFDPQTNQWINA